MSETQLPEPGVLKFGDILIDRTSFTVFRGGQQVELTPRAFDVLDYLVENRGRVVGKQEIFDSVWDDTFVTDNALMRAIREIRRELGDTATGSKYIETAHKRGYRFIAEVQVVEPLLEESEQKTGAELSVQRSLDHLGANKAPTSAARGRFRFAISLGLILTVVVGATAFAIYYARSERHIRAIAVMPLENVSSADTEHISDGISEGVINNLSELPEIKVVARATAFRYKDREFDPQRVRSELNVDAILTGRLVQTGDDVTIQADLIDATDGTQIWGSRYSRKLATVYDLPGAITADLVRKLGLNLNAGQAARLKKNSTQNPEANRLYSLGRYFWNKRSEDALNKSIEYFLKAIERDPNYALAYAGLADSYAVMAISADLPAHEVFPKAREAALKALELDEGLVEAHATMLRIKSQYEWDWDGAESEYRRALELNPNYPMTYVYYFSYLVATGRADQGVASVEKARALDPLSLVTNAVMARALFFERRYDEAIEASLKTLELDPNVFLARLILGRSYARKGMFNEAIAELQTATQSPGSVSEAKSLLAYTLAVSGRSKEARELLNELKRLSASRYVQPYDIAIVYAGLGDTEEAFDWLEKAYQDRNHQVSLIDQVPEFEGIKPDPRFPTIVQRFRSSS